jgi:citrate synthase
MQASGETKKVTLSITDNRTGKAYEVLLSRTTPSVRSICVRLRSMDDFGMMTYDPAFMKHRFMQEQDHVH